MNAILQKALAKGAPQWNELSAQERLKYILNNQDVFLSSQLVLPGEILAARVTPESAREYIIEREDSPFFSTLDIKKPLDDQSESATLKRALEIA